MKNAIFVLSVLMIGIILFGCASQQVSHTGEDNVNVQPNVTVQPEKNVTVQPGGLEFSVPSELPVAYVGTPYFYSLSQFCSGGNPPYSFSIQNITGWSSITGLSTPSFYKIYASYGILNFTPKKGDENQYVLEVCASDSTSESHYAPLCKNTTLYIMSDIVTVKGEGELTPYLLLEINSDVEAADFVVPDQHEDVKEVATQYVPAANFSPLKMTAEVPASSQCGITTGLAWCGAGSRAEVNIFANATSVSMTAEGSAPCGKSYGSAYHVDYYHAGFNSIDSNRGYGASNVYIALNITNTGTKEKAIDVYLNVSSELDPGSQNYFKPARSHAILCIGDHCVRVQAAKPGDALVNSTVLRVLVRPGSHLLYIGGMANSVDNTNKATCPSFAKASGTLSVTIVPADMSNGKKAIGLIYSESKESDVWYPR